MSPKVKNKTLYIKRVDQLKEIIQCKTQEIKALKLEIKKNKSLQKEKLQDIADYYENLIGVLPGHVYWMDKNNVFLGCNDLQAKNAGLRSRKDIVGKTNYDMLWKDQADDLNKLNLSVMENGIAYTAEEYAIMANGPGIYLSQKVPLRDKNNEIIGMLGISFDITERKRMEEDLVRAKEAAQAADKAKTEFLANMRHDLRTPLTGIIGFANLIKTETADSKIAEYSDNMLAASHTLLEFLNEVLEAIHITSGEMPLLKTKFDLKTKLDSVISLHQVKAKEKKILLTLNYDRQIPRYVVGDFKRIQRIFLELIANALNFTHKGEIKTIVKLEKQKEHDVVIKIIVSDSGIGIPEDKKEEIYLQFNRLNPSYNGIYKGLGLGLTIVQQFVNDLKAEIYVESKINCGTTFTCYIPLQESLIDDEFGVDQSQEKLAQGLRLENDTSIIRSTHKILQDSENSSKTTHILLVEDQKVAAMVTSEMLSKINCRVDVVPTGYDAIEQFKKQKYEFVILDVGLPDMSGNEVANKIRKWELLQESYTPIIALTAHVGTHEKQACIEAGMDIVLSKPLLPETAKDILTAFLPVYKNKLSSSNKVDQKEKITKRDLLNIKGEVINFNTVVEKYGDKSFVEKMLQLLIASFPQELSRLEKAHEKKDWASIQEIAHKILGGAYYCGTPRLIIACKYLENYLREGFSKIREALYQQLLNEIEAVKSHFSKN